jgi:hypothetical protein
VIKDYMEREAGRLQHFYKYEGYAKLWKAALGNRTLREITTGDIDRFIARRRNRMVAAP